MNKKICSLFATFILLINLTGCTKCVSTDYSTVNVKIVDKYYRGSYTTIMPMRVGKVTTMHSVIHPAIYRITVEYSGVKYDISDSVIYGKYKDRIGEIVEGTLETKTYDDDSVKKQIVALS